MTNYTITFGGVSSVNVGITLLDSLKLSAPAPRAKKYTVPGRNGDVYIYDGSFENRTATVQGCMYHASRVKDSLADLNEWLFSSLGYRRLVTSDDPNHYLMARVTNGAEINAKAMKVAPFTIKFDCKPQRFRTSGDRVYTAYANGLTFGNSTAFPSKPFLEIAFDPSKSITGNVYFNDIPLSLDFQQVANYTTLYFDTETQTAYVMTSGNVAVMYEGVVEGGENISLVPGTNEIDIDGGVTSVKITPRWWDL